MNCPGCKARNPIGNKFCRECGQKIPLEENILVQEEAQKAEAERARERAAQLLTRAFTLSQHGKPAEALPLAEEAVELLPESTSALTLCSTLYERLGQNDKAIAMMERVVSSNPDSSVDADKLARLKRGVHVLPNRPTLAEAPDDESPRRWVPVAAAIVAGGLALSLGIFAVVKLTGKKEPNLVPLAITEVDKTKGPNFFGGQVATPGGMTGGPLSAPRMEARSDPFAPVGSRPMGATSEPRRSFRERPERSERPRSNGSPVLPNPRDAQPSSGSESVPPVTFPNSSGPVGNQLPPLGGVQRGPDSIPAAPPAQNPPPSNGNPEGNTPSTTDNSGFIRVREHSTGTGSGANSNGELRSSSLGGDPLLRAQTLQASGRYREAITAFREALAAGAVAGDVQQGIALCHQRLGEKAPARSAYQQAIVAFEAQVRGGRSVEQAQRGISVCRAALDVLGS